VITKKDGEIRICNNFIKLNKRMIPEPCIMGNTVELLNRVAGGTYLSRLDLKKAFLQVKVYPRARASFQSSFVLAIFQNDNRFDHCR